MNAFLRYSPAVAAYLERHRIDPDLAYEVGVRSDGDSILYSYARRDGTTYARRRDLNDPNKRTLQPEGEPLMAYCPTGRPERDEAVVLLEGEADTLVGAQHLNGNGRAVGIPGTEFPVERIVAEVAQAKKVILALDNDKAGRQAMDRIAGALQPLGIPVHVLGLPEGRDLCDVLVGEEDPAGWLAEALARAPRAPKLSTEQESGGYGARSRSKNSGEEERKSAATQLVELAREGVSLFHSPDEIAYAVLGAAGHEETWRVRSKRFRSWLARRFFEEQGKAPGAQALQDALNVLEGISYFDAAEESVHLRIAEHCGRIYLDLGDETWSAVEISSDGWGVISKPPVRFRRPAGLAPLPRPVQGGSVDDMREFLNLADEADWILNTAWLVAALRPSGPYPILELVGEQGSAKSTHARVTRSLVDPATSPLRRPPREGRDLMIAASNGWVVALDNLSSLNEWLADDLCRLATGGGFATRALFTDDDEVIFDAMRPIVLTGINGVSGERGDLLDRVVNINLPRITERGRRREEDLLADFERVRPRVLGALLDAVAAALGRVDTIELERLPRMADFATWAVAAGPTLGWEGAAFLGAYDARRSQSHVVAVESSPIGPAVVDIAADGFAGTATELLTALEGDVDEKITKRKEWPKTPAGLGGALRRLAPDLRGVGLEVEFDREGKNRRREIRLGTAPDKNEEGNSRPPRPPRPRAGESGRKADSADSADSDLRTHSDRPLPTQGEMLEMGLEPMPERD